jgi:hypothetical protein
MINREYLLNDAQMRFFIRNGYMTVKTNLPESFHAEVFRRTETVFEKEGNPGNNLLPRIPLVQEVFDDPSVKGALTSIFGPNYYLHPHRHCHYNPPGGKGQNMHKDSWTRRRHHIRWGMAFYYPQDTPEELGPTGVIPESQYYNAQPDQNGRKGETLLCGEAGTVTIVHYDLWHRATPNRSDKKRYMMKFLFTRMEEPETPSWNNTQSDWEPVHDEQDVMWRHLWNWNAGRRNGNGASDSGLIPALIETLKGPSESANFNAAYTLAQIGEAALPALMETLCNESEAIRRNASYALSAIGAPAVSRLIDAMRADNSDLHAITAEALGDIGPEAQDAIPALTEALKSSSVAVRRNATEALGIISQKSEMAASALAQMLKDSDEWVRRNASLALAKKENFAEAALPELKAALKDENRYVRANAAHALYRIHTPQATEALLRFLMTSRWCPSTTPESAY